MSGLLCFSFLSGAAARWLARTDESLWNTDEGISYLLSTCHLAAFEDAIQAGADLTGRWAPAAIWQDFLQSSGQLCFGTIRHDLVHADVHPPLYFWLLHVWTLLFGSSLRAGAALNLAIFAAGLLALERLARRVLASRWEALAVCLLASLNGIVVQASIEFRPYALLTSMTMIFALALERCCASQVRRRHYAALALATTAGLLTHVLFWFTLPAFALYALLRIRDRGIGRVARVAGCGISGLALATALFPFAAQWSSRAPAVISRYRGIKLDSPSVLSVRNFLTEPLTAGVGVLIACSLLALGLHAWRVRSWPSSRHARWHQGVEILVLSVGATIAVMIPHAAGLSPPHATGPKYMAAVWFLLPFIPVLAVRALGRWKDAGLALLCGLSLITAAQRAWAQRGGAALSAYREHDARVIAHTTNRLHLPRLLAILDPHALVRVASVESLQQQARRLGEHGAFSYAMCSGDNPRAGKRLLRRLRAQYRLVSHTWAGWCWTLYRFEANPTRPAALVTPAGQVTKSFDPHARQP